MEFFNVVKSMEGKEINNQNDAKNTAVYVFGFTKRNIKLSRQLF